MYYNIMPTELNKIDKDHVLDLTIKVQSCLMQGRIYSAGQFIEEMRYILENKG